MTVAQAADAWIEAKREQVKLEARLGAAAEVLKDHFRKTGRSTYRGAISYAVTTRRTLDTAKVKAELGSRLENFQRVVEVEQLSLLEAS